MGGTWLPVVVGNRSGQLSAFVVSYPNRTLYRYDQAAVRGLGVAPVDGWDVAV